MEVHGLMADENWVALVDNAARGDLDAIADLAEAYYKGIFLYRISFRIVYFQQTNKV